MSRVERFWWEILGQEDFLLRPRMSRIFYDGKFFDYPLRAVNALRNLGISESILCVLSYLRVRLRPPADQPTFEGWVSARFGRRLYRIFFKSYTEKLWGIPAHQIQADWAAQRIKNLSLGAAIISALSPNTATALSIVAARCEEAGIAADLGEAGLVVPAPAGPDGDGGVRGSRLQSRWLIHTDTWAGSRAWCTTSDR